jgi:hypothetical protein
VFTARCALSPYIKQISFVFKGLKEELDKSESDWHNSMRAGAANSPATLFHSLSFLKLVTKGSTSVIRMCDNERSRSRTSTITKFKILIIKKIQNIFKPTPSHRTKKKKTFFVKSDCYEKTTLYWFSVFLLINKILKLKVNKAHKAHKIFVYLLK